MKHCQQLSVNTAYTLSLAQLVENWQERGGTLYLVTFTYKNPPRGTLSLRSAETRFYEALNHLLRYLCGSDRTGRSWFRSIEPAGFAFIDEPASEPKHTKPRNPSAFTADYHHHCIMAIHPHHVERMKILANECERFDANNEAPPNAPRKSRTPLTKHPAFESCLACCQCMSKPSTIPRKT